MACAWPGGRKLNIKIPPESLDGPLLGLRGQSGGGWNDGPAGDALIELSVAPHPSLPATTGMSAWGCLWACEGPCCVAPSYCRRPVRMQVPPRSDSGTELRLRGRGLPACGGLAAGKLYATLQA